MSTPLNPTVFRPDDEVLYSGSVPEAHGIYRVIGYHPAESRLAGRLYLEPIEGEHPDRRRLTPSYGNRHVTLLARAGDLHADGATVDQAAGPDA